MSGDPGMKFAHHVSTYFKQLLMLSKGCTRDTVASYSTTFSLLCGYIGDEMASCMNISEFTKEMVVGFLKHLKEDRDCTDSTCNTRLAHIRSFNAYLMTELPAMMEECTRIASIPLKKVQKEPPHSLSVDAVEALLNGPNTRTREGLRDAVLMATLYDSACRVDELIGLDVGDVSFGSNSFITVFGKGRKKRTIPILKKTADMLKKYIDRFRLTDDDMVLFPSRSGGRMTRQGITYILNKYADPVRKEHPELIGKDEPVSPHVLRHSKATHLIDSGKVSIYEVKEFLGHESVQTTEMYITPNAKRTREAVEMASEAIGIIGATTYSTIEKKSLDTFLKTLKK